MSARTNHINRLQQHCWVEIYMMETIEGEEEESKETARKKETPK